MKRVYRVMKFLVLGLFGILAIALIVTGVANWRAGTRLEQKIADLRAAGEPVTMTDLARKAIPPDKNAATYLRRAKDGIEAIQKEVDAASDADQDSIETGQLTPAMRETLNAAFDAYPNVVELLAQAAACPDYDPQFDYTVDAQLYLGNVLTDQISLSRSAIRVLGYRSSLLLADGKPEEALRTSETMLRLSRHFDNDPMLLSYLVALACRGVAIHSANRALRAGPISEAARDALEKELAQHDLVVSFRQAMRGERVLGLQLIREMNMKIAPWPIDMALAPWPFGPKIDPCLYIEAMDAAIDADSSARAEATRLFERGGGVIALMIPSVQAAASTVARGQSQLRCLRVLNAVQRYEQAGRTPEPKLSDLGLPADAITDPYNGEPLHLKKRLDAWLVYSVGIDLKDGGGEKLEDQYGEDIGLGPDRPAAKPVASEDSSGEAKVAPQ